MIPLRDDIPSSRRPVMTVSIIALTSIVFLYELSLPSPALEEFFRRFGVVPREFLGGESGYLPLFSAMLLHGGWLHILGNMLFLWIFGDNVEDLTGPGKFLALYLLAGVAGNLAHVYTNPGSTLPTIGASGAVAGVLGAYMVNFPRARIITLLPLGFFLMTTEVPAGFFLAFWFLLQLANGVAALGVPVAPVQGVAWWAHVGGFLAGVVLIYLLRERRPGYHR
jgi:membrane associated rhomboid family serine protease